MPIFAVHYTYSDDTRDLREEFRPEHRGWLTDLNGNGIVLESGRYPDGSGALIIFRGTDADEIRTLLKDDPFDKRGLVGGVRLMEWAPHFGAINE